jgi:hypothetical protein
LSVSIRGPRPQSHDVPAFALPGNAAKERFGNVGCFILYEAGGGVAHPSHPDRLPASARKNCVASDRGTQNQPLFDLSSGAGCPPEVWASAGLRRACCRRSCGTSFPGRDTTGSAARALWSMITILERRKASRPRGPAPTPSGRRTAAVIVDQRIVDPHHARLEPVGCLHQLGGIVVKTEAPSPKGLSLASPM